MTLRNAATLSRAGRERKKAFFRALLEAGLSMSAWARQEGVTPGHLSQVLAEKRPGFGLDNKITDFIAQHARKVG